MRSVLPLFSAIGKAVSEPSKGYVQQVLSHSLSTSTSASASAATGPGAKAHYAAALSGLMAGIFGASVVASGDEVADGLHAPNYPWPHEGIFDSYDHASIRRGHQVYQQVCAACHSMKYLHWRQLVGVCYTEDEAKAMAADTDVVDGPNDEGEMFERPGRLSDKVPAPYSSEQQARYANGGAYPPDLSLIVGARHNGANYVYALLTGYCEPPAGVKVREGLYYNPYFPGGAIAMPRMLNDGGVEYDDGTPANASQQAKDVTTFLAWSSYPYQDEMRVMGLKALLVLGLCFGFASYSKRLRWAPLKSQRIVLDVVN